MFKKSLVLCLFVLAFAACSKPPATEQVQESIKQFIPVNFEVLRISEFKGIPGLYEVVISVSGEPVVLYVDKKAKFVLSGNIMSTEDKANLTLQTQQEFRKK